MILLGTSVNAQWWKRIKGNGNTITQTRQTADYDKVSVSGSFDVQLVQGKEGDIILKGEENLLEYIEVAVKNNVLVLKVKDNINLSSSWNKSISIEVPVTEIAAVKLSGSGDISSEITLAARDFNAAVSGSGDISLNIDATNLVVQVSGSGDMKLTGSAQDLQVKISGSGGDSLFISASSSGVIKGIKSASSSIPCSDILSICKKFELLIALYTRHNVICKHRFRF